MSEEAVALARVVAEGVRRWLDTAGRAPERRVRTSDMQWGFAIVDGTDVRGGPCFLLVTITGESVVLTHRMLRALSRRVVLIAGEVVAMLEATESAGDADEPVQRLQLLLLVGVHRPTPADYCSVSAVVGPKDLVPYAPWVFLVDSRPDGWPA